MSRIHHPTVRELGRRARRLRLVVSDVDGVVTDGGVYYSETGEPVRRLCVRDGVGVERLRDHGIETAFLGEEMSRTTVRRAGELGVVQVHLAADDKASELLAMTRSAGCSLAETAYLGDDDDDVEAMRLLAPHGLVAAPADAMGEVLRLAHHRCATAGGLGAFRDFAEWLLRHRRLALARAPSVSDADEPTRP